MQMNLPNKLTVFRVLLIPVFLVFMMAKELSNHYLWAALIFAAASFTDYLDGHIARKHHLVTDFGKFMDPLADKLLVMSAMLCFVREDWASLIGVIVILAREFLVTSVRLIAASHGTVIAADIWGKIKTVLQIIWVLYTLLVMWMEGIEGIVPQPVYWGIVILQALVVLTTVLSGWNYLWKNRSLLADMK